MGAWVNAQKNKYNKGVLSRDKIEKLEKYVSKGWLWGNKHDRQWEENYKLLQSYVEREGTARVPYSHKEGEIALGGWVSAQKNNS